GLGDFAGEEEVGEEQFLVGLALVGNPLHEPGHGGAGEGHAFLGVGDRVTAHVAAHPARVDRLARRAHVVRVVAESEFGLGGAVEERFEPAGVLGTVFGITELDGPAVVWTGAGGVVLALLASGGREVHGRVVHD